MQRIKYFLLYLVFSVCKAIGSIFPRNRKRLIFGAWLGNKYDDNPKALYEYILKKRPELHPIWLTSNKTIFNELSHKQIPVCMTNSIKGIWFCLVSKYVCYCVEPNDIGLYLYPLLNGCIFINLWHGIPLKRVGNHNKFSKQYREEYLGKFTPKAAFWVEKCDQIRKSISANKTYHMAPGDELGKIYQGVFGVDETHILKLGQARNDYFFTHHQNPIVNRFSKKIRVVYMPTHRKEGRDTIDLNKIFNLSRLNEFCRNNNIVFLIKKHFYHRNEPTIPDFKYSNIYELTSEPIKTQELVEAADILITDYSGVYIDYLLLNRPMIFYAFDKEDYMKTDRDFYLPYDPEYIPGKICITEENLIKELQNLCEGVDDTVDIRNKMKKYYYSIEAQSAVSEIQTNTIISL